MNQLKVQLYFALTSIEWDPKERPKPDGTYWPYQSHMHDTHNRVIKKKGKENEYLEGVSERLGNAK